MHEGAITLDGTLFAEWLKLCASTDEFVSNYNRLRGSRISFAIPNRSPFEAMSDQATGHVPMPRNDPRELSAFMAFCFDLFQRIPEPA